MRWERNYNRLKESLAERYSAMLPVDDRFYDSLLGIDGDYVYRLEGEHEVKGRSAFGDKEMSVKFFQKKDVLPRIKYNEQTYPLESRYAGQGEHNIKLGEVRVIEHVLAMLTALNLNLDFELSESSFPLLARCNREYLEVMTGKLIRGEATRYFTVKEPVGGFFGETQEGYFILEPDEGERKLIIDHQVSYPGLSVGLQRLRVPMTPELFTGISGARTPSFRSPEETDKILDDIRENRAKGRESVYGIGPENVLFVTPEKIYNPRVEYDYRGVNYEFMFHELMDITAWLKFVDLTYGGKFVGRMTTYRFDHHAQVDAARFVCEDPRMEEIGMVYE